MFLNDINVSLTDFISQFYTIYSFERVVNRDICGNLGRFLTENVVDDTNTAGFYAVQHFSSIQPHINIQTRVTNNEKDADFLLLLSSSSLQLSIYIFFLFKFSCVARSSRIQYNFIKATHQSKNVAFFCTVQMRHVLLVSVVLVVVKKKI